MVEIKLTLMNRSGLHARPAAQFTQTAGNYKETKINIIKDGPEINAKSILGVMSMGLSCGTTITIKADGPEEAEAAKALTDLIESGFGEL